MVNPPRSLVQMQIHATSNNTSNKGHYNFLSCDNGEDSKKAKKAHLFDILQYAMTPNL